MNCIYRNNDDPYIYFKLDYNYDKLLNFFKSKPNYD